MFPFEGRFSSLAIKLNGPFSTFSLVQIIKLQVYNSAIKQKTA